jgi:hypothetical protein
MALIDIDLGDFSYADIAAYVAGNDRLWERCVSERAVAMRQREIIERRKEYDATERSLAEWISLNAPKDQP